MPRSRSPRDGCVLPAEPVREIVDGWLEWWKRRHPPVVGKPYGAAGQMAPALPGLDALAAEASRLAGRPVTRAQLEGLVDTNPRRAKPWVELWLVDALGCAVGRPELLYLLRDEVRRNPQATEAARRECCAGSQQDRVAA